MNTTTLILISIGLCAGMLSGLFGIGGGTVIVPALVFLLGFSQHKATGTSLAVLLPPVGIAAVAEYARHGAVDWRAAIIIAVTVFIGAAAGALFANKMSGATLKFLFSIFLICLGFYSLWNSRGVLLPKAGAEVPVAKTAVPLRQVTPLLSDAALTVKTTES